MAKILELLFDFASPNVYFAYRALPPILARTGAQLAVTPCLLGGLFKLTGNRAPMVAFADIKGKWDYERLEIRRFIARHRLEKFKMNPHFPVNSLNLNARTGGGGKARRGAGLHRSGAARLVGRGPETRRSADAR